MDWIKVESPTPRKPEVLKLARILDVTPDDAFGKAMRFWLWLDGVCVDGRVDGVAPQDVDAIVARAGFCDALCTVNWCRYEHENERLIVPNWERHNGQSAKARALKSKRQAKYLRRSRGAHVDARVDGSASTALLFSYTFEALAEKGLIPEPLRCDDFGEVWNKWVKHRSEISKPLKETQVHAQLKKFAGWGFDRSKRSIMHTIEMGWQGIREPENAEGAVSRGGQRTFEQIKVDNTKEAARKFAELMDAKDAQRTVQHGS